MKNKQNRTVSVQSTRESGNGISWFSVLKRSWQSALHIDRSQITAVQAVRGTIGFVLPLALGVATGHVVEGVSLAGGAATLGAVGLTYTYRARTRTLLLACAGIAFSAFVGSLVGRIDWLAILVLGLWGFGAGLLVAISQPAMVIGIQSILAFIILSHFALDPLHALLQALLMFAGALFQTLLAILPFPRRYTTPERAALAATYQKLADYTLDSAKEQNRRDIRSSLLQAYTTLRDTNVRSQQGKMFIALFEEAERIRLIIIALTRLCRNLSQNTPLQEEYTALLEQLLQTSAGILRQVAQELTSARKITDDTSLVQQLQHILTILRGQHVAMKDEEAMQQVVGYGDNLYEQLSTTLQLAASKGNGQQTPPVNLMVPLQNRLRLRDAWTTLRANVTFRSTYFRHAVRMGVTLALATALYRITTLPIQRGYWIALTALLVLRPDFITTVTRGIARLLGTLLGAVLTTVLVATLAPTKEILVLLDATAAYIAFSLLFANYALFSAFITIEVVFLLTFVEPQPLETVAYRAIDTIIGGVLALGIYILWPTWEHPQVLNNIAYRLETLRSYFVAVMKAYSDPEAYDVHEIDARRIDTRLARSNADLSVQHSQQEPETRRIHRVDPELAEGLLDAADIVAQSTLLLEAFLVDNPIRHTLPETTPFTNAVDEALHILAASIQKGQPIETFPNLKESLSALEHTAQTTNSSAQQATPTDLQVVLTEAKSVVRSINTMKQLLTTRTQQEA